MVVDPGPRPVANPVSLMVATLVSLLVHVTPSPATATGVKASAVVPFPSRPSPFSPQHCTPAPCRSAQVCSAPDVTSVAVVIPVTGADGGVAIAPIREPFPSWPQAWPPQQRRGPSWRSAQVCQPPAKMATAVVMPLTVTGVGVKPPVGATVPLPSWPRSFCPQQRTVPSPGSAQVWKPPAVTAV